MSEPEDPFEDLGKDRRSAGDKLAERDITHPEPVERPPERPRPSSRYAWLVGVAFFIIVVVAAINAIPDAGEGTRGPRPGTTLRPFAAPNARSGLDFDANLCARRPCNERIGKRPACEVRGPRVVNLCDLRRDALVLTFIFDRAADCYPQADRVQRTMRGVPGARFAIVYFSRKKPHEVKRIVERRRWTMPVALDRDGAIVNLYGVGGCPITIFAGPGGKVRETLLGNLTEAQLRTHARRLIR